jgi:hypothetical protein
VTRAVLDDHLLRDLLADEAGGELARLLTRYEPATTNLYYLRLCRSALSAHGGSLTGSWSVERRRELARSLVALPETIEIVPLRGLAFQMAELIDGHPVSTLGAEAVAAAIVLEAPLCVWAGDDGAGIRSAAASAGVTYQTVSRRRPSSPGPAKRVRAG